MPTREQFLKQNAPAAKAATAGTHVFPQTILAAAAVESGNGNSLLSSKYYNFFGIKADSSWKSEKVYMKTREVVNGKSIYINAPFRAYPNATEGFKGYVAFLTKNKRYQAALNAPNWKDQIRAIARAGYATDPNYSNTLINVGNKIKANPGTTGAFVVATAATIIYLSSKRKRAA